MISAFIPLTSSIASTKGPKSSEILPSSLQYLFLCKVINLLLFSLINLKALSRITQLKFL